MNKHVSSKDPRKSQIVKALKQASGGTKVTMVKEVGYLRFEGDCFERSAGIYPHAPDVVGWKDMGRFFVQFAKSSDTDMGPGIDYGTVAR